MSKDYKEITGSLTEMSQKYSNESSEFMQNFRNLSQSAFKPGAIDTKNKEWIALAIGIAKQCDGCIGFHTRKAIKLGTTRQEFIEILNVAVYMGGGPSLMYAYDALLAFEQFSAQQP